MKINATEHAQVECIKELIIFVILVTHLVLNVQDHNITNVLLVLQPWLLLVENVEQNAQMEPIFIQMVFAIIAISHAKLVLDLVNINVLIVLLT